MNIPITDTHQHLIYPDKWPYSWTDGIAQLKGQAFRYDDYQRAIAGSGVTKTIFMETSPDDPHFHAETKFVYELSAPRRQASRNIWRTSVIRSSWA
jgi:predicted TIM-barrel fold metal-dependent hydrolase